MSVENNKTIFAYDLNAELKTSGFDAVGESVQ
jgi:hypothetical protein